MTLFTAKISCPHTDLQCPNGDCIMREWECDGQYDCGDGFDELSCGKFIRLNIFSQYTLSKQTCYYKIVTLKAV